MIQELLFNIWHIATKPDNVPIVGMLLLVIFFTWLSFRLAIRNDRLRADPASQPDPELAGKARQKGVVLVRDVMYPESDQGLPTRVLTWPYLLKIEMLAALFVTALLVIWSLAIDAPLEEPANPGLSPNPAKAPWYFVGLQDMLVYFDPWIAGVVLPLLIIFGLMVIPYLDMNPKGNGYYTLRERPWSIAVFCFGFLVLWVLFIVIGTFLRGPGWSWFWPWEKWDSHRVVFETNIDLNELLARIPGLSFLATPAAGFVLGAVVIGAYYVLGTLVPYRMLERRNSPTLKKLGRARYGIVVFLLLTMMGLPIKVLMRLLFNVKYFWVTPWFNI
jgi:hypothetical protein